MEKTETKISNQKKKNGKGQFQTIIIIISETRMQMRLLNANFTSHLSVSLSVGEFCGRKFSNVSATVYKSDKILLLVFDE